MRLQPVAVDTRMPDWVQIGSSEYSRRFPKDTPLKLVKIPAGKHDRNADIRYTLGKEGEMMLAATGKNRTMTLDAPGKPWDTLQLARELERWKQDGRDVSSLVDDLEGLSPACKAAAERSWSFSTLIPPHSLVRILVAESLYRAWSITTNHPRYCE